MLEEIKKLVESNPKQLSVDEYLTIANQVKNEAPCNFLVFGLGNDSSLWMKINEKGNTVFIEDNEKWYNKIKTQYNRINAHLVNYDTLRKNAKLLLNEKDKLELKLHESILKTKWDIIFVDAPRGNRPELPGRMKSIYMASKLAQNSNKTYVFVHDCNRKVERMYCDQYLLKDNLICTVGKLRTYLIR